MSVAGGGKMGIFNYLKERFLVRTALSLKPGETYFQHRDTAQKIAAKEKSLLKPDETYGQYFIESFNKAYTLFKSKNPLIDPHFILAELWRKWMGSLGMNIKTTKAEMESFYITRMCACIPEPDCSKALAMEILMNTVPDEFSDLWAEYDSLMSPVIQASENGTIKELYRKYNHDKNLVYYFG